MPIPRPADVQKMVSTDRFPISAMRLSFNACAPATSFSRCFIFRHNGFASTNLSMHQLWQVYDSSVATVGNGNTTAEDDFGCSTASRNSSGKRAVDRRT
jgi:hypothetical protein